VLIQPGYKFLKILRTKADLATPTRVRTDESLVECSYMQREFYLDYFTEILCQGLALFIEINMSMIGSM
jgi:hypothetical protein